jgi:TolA-binding protein
MGEIDSRPRATQNVVPDPVIRAKKEIVEATAYLELAKIFKSMGLAKGAKEKSAEGLDRVDGILRTESPIPSALREEAFKLKWELYIAQDDFADAVTTCRLFNRLYPDSPFVDQALMGIGTIRLENKDHAEAIKVFQQILTMPNSQVKAEAQFRIAECIEAQAAARPRPATAPAGPSEAAIQQYKLCADRYPESPFAGQALAKLVDYHVEQKDYARAEDLLTQVFQDYPDGDFLDGMLLKWVIVAYRMNDFQKAYNKCSQLIFEYPASPHAKKAKEILPKIESRVKGKEEAVEEKKEE